MDSGRARAAEGVGRSGLARPDEIAGELGRSEAAVRVRAWQHGMALRLVTQKRGP
ncbi:hypothetical protein [Bradyrhizobium sp. WSM4349]|uniref:hypothetical protein n=1 Tax=Bradyrhizobium sp. WSM4349 TaxID=1040988 RepID=UPI0003748381|nr:hypothetical protein [Bradyrhizobium sp. WSM4349]